MIEDASGTLKQIRRGAPRHLDERVLAVIQDSQPREYSGPTVAVAVGDILPTWKVRAEINSGTDHPLIGAEDLISTLQSQPSDYKIRQVSLSSKASHCILVFDWASEEFLGSLLIRRRTPDEERARNKKLAAMGIAVPSEEYVSAL